MAIVSSLSQVSHSFLLMITPPCQLSFLSILSMLVQWFGFRG